MGIRKTLRRSAAISRILFPTAALAGVGETTTIPLDRPLLTGSSNLPGDGDRADLYFRPALSRRHRSVPPYLVLLRAGFCLPRAFLRARCALTAPFHHCLLLRASAVCFLCHCPSSCPDRALPGALPSGVRTFLPAVVSPELTCASGGGRWRGGCLPCCVGMSKNQNQLMLSHFQCSDRVAQFQNVNALDRGIAPRERRVCK